jgi:hypothetical protein
MTSLVSSWYFQILAIFRDKTFSLQLLAAAQSRAQLADSLFLDNITEVFLPASCFIG